MIDHNDTALTKRARLVVPGGMYGHMNVRSFSATLPQYMATGDGCRLTDSDGNTYLDFMCGWCSAIAIQLYNKRFRSRSPRATASTARLR